MPKRRRLIGLPPGTLVFTGEQKIDEPTIVLTQYNESEVIEKKLTQEQPLSEEEKQGKLVTWYDIRGLHDANLIEKIGRKFQIHPLVLEDIMDSDQRPKFEEYDNGVFIIFRAMDLDKDLEIQTEQVAIYVGESFVLSFQENATDLFVAVRQRIEQAKGKVRKKGSDYLAYALIDSVVDYYYVILDKLEDSIEKREEEILSDPNDRTKGQLHHLKLQMLTLRKSVSPLREAVSRFSKSDSKIIHEGTDIFLRDLYDHTVQIMDAIETYRDMLNGLYDLYLSEISFKMNNVMQVLTIITTIFVPLSFLAGLYGMNFQNMPELQWRYGYFALLSVMGVIFVGLLFYFRRKKWI